MFDLPPSPGNRFSTPESTSRDGYASWNQQAFSRGVDLFREARNRSRLYWLKMRLTGGSNQLRDLNKLIGQFQSRHSRSLGTLEIGITQIVGTEGRVTDFDNRFNPLRDSLRDRWAGIAAAHLQGAFLPPITLIQVGGEYYIRDGHHRVSVAKSLGAQEIDADVTVWEIGESVKLLF